MFLLKGKSLMITFNGLTNSKDIVTFSNCPNILTFDNSETGEKRDALYRFAITYSGIRDYDPAKDYTIEFGGSVLTGTTDSSRVGGTTYLLPTTTDTQEHRYCAMTIANALRSIPFVASNFDVFVEASLSDGSLSSTVAIKSRKASASMNVDFSCNWDGGYTFTEDTVSENPDTMLQGSTGANFIVVDVYRYRDQIMIGETPDDTRFDYVTTLQKNYFGEKVDFNVTPLLCSMLDGTEYDETVLYKMVVYGFSGDKLVFSQPTQHMYFTNGYMCNFSSPYLAVSQMTWAANLKRGSRYDGSFNNTTMYTYHPQVDFSVYNPGGNPLNRVMVYYIDSAMNDFKRDTITVEEPGGKTLKQYTIMLDEEAFAKASYVDIRLWPLTDRYRYNVIKPIKAADENAVERIYWFNEYGGVSFMDFTGERSETRKEDIEYYERQSFDFYTAEEREVTKVYSKKILIEVDHRTHYIDKNGTFLLYSLQASKKAWIWHRGTKHYIHVTSLDISESQNASHVYVAQITYKYSFEDAF